MTKKEVLKAARTLLDQEVSCNSSMYYGTIEYDDGELQIRQENDDDSTVLTIHVCDVLEDEDHYRDNRYYRLVFEYDMTHDKYIRFDEGPWTEYLVELTC